MTEKYIETERGCVHYWYEPGSNPNAKCLHFIPNAAHNSNIDHPEAVNSLIEDFVNRLS